MNATPRTDAESSRVYDDEKQYEESYDVAVAAWEWARSLEREINALKELIVHAEIHGAYKRSGYNQMTTEQKALWDSVWESRDENLLTPSPETAKISP